MRRFDEIVANFEVGRQYIKTMAAGPSSTASVRQQSYAQAASNPPPPPLVQMAGFPESGRGRGRGNNPSRGRGSGGTSSSRPGSRASSPARGSPFQKHFKYYLDRQLCTRCGAPHTEQHVCPALTKTCKICGKVGHYAGVCSKNDNSPAMRAVAAAKKSAAAVQTSLVVVKEEGEQMDTTSCPPSPISPFPPTPPQLYAASHAEAMLHSEIEIKQEPLSPLTVTERDLLEDAASTRSSPMHFGWATPTPPPSSSTRVGLLAIADGLVATSTVTTNAATATTSAAASTAPVQRASRGRGRKH